MRSIPAEGAAGGCIEGTPPADWARGRARLPCGLVAPVMLGWLCMHPGARSSMSPANRREPWDSPGKKKWEDSVEEVFMEDPRDLPRDASMWTCMAVAGGSKMRALREAGSAE